MTHAGHLSNWSILVTALATAAFCWVWSQWTPTARAGRKVRDAKLVRLSRRCIRLEMLWRQAGRGRDDAQRDNELLREQNAALWAENEALTDDLCAAQVDMRLVAGQLARQIGHPSQRSDADLFDRLEQEWQR